MTNDDGRNASSGGGAASWDDMIARVLAAGEDHADPGIETLLSGHPGLTQECAAALGVEVLLRRRAKERALDLAEAETVDDWMSVDDVLSAIDRGDARPGTAGTQSEPPVRQPEEHRPTGPHRTDPLEVPIDEPSELPLPTPSLSPPAPGVPPLVYSLRWAAAAAAVLLVGWFLWRGGPSDRPDSWDRGMHMGDGVRYVSPVGDSANVSRFEWVAEQAPMERFVVVVYDDRGIELVRSPRLDETTWTCSKLEDYAGEILWRVLVIDSANNSTDGELQRARSR